MLQDLIDRVGSDAITEPQGLVVGFDRDEDAVNLRVQLFDVEYGRQPLEVWRVTCSEIRDFRIGHSAGLVAAFGMTHSAVRQYVDPPVEVFFAGKPSSGYRLAHELRIAHQRIAGDWIPFERYMNRSPLPELLEKGGGKVFTGPLFLANEIETVLRDAHLSVTQLPRYVGAQPAVVSSPLEMLVVGESFIVASEFETVAMIAAQQRLAADGLRPPLKP